MPRRGKRDILGYKKTYKAIMSQARSLKRPKGA